MREIILNLYRFSAVMDIHNYIAKKFKFPAYYGKNLDALYDLLGDIGEELCIVIKPGKGRADIYEGFIRVFEAAAEENAKLSIHIVGMGREDAKN